MKKLKSLKKGQIIKSYREIEISIKSKCFDCVGGMKKTDCEIKDCPLYRFRPWSKMTKLEILSNKQT